MATSKVALFPRSLDAHAFRLILGLLGLTDGSNQRVQCLVPVKAMARGAAGGVLAELRLFARNWLAVFLQQGQALGAIRTDVPFELLMRIVLALEEGIDLWLGDRITDMTPAEIEETAAMLADLYRRLAEPSREARTSQDTTSTSTSTKRPARRK